MEDLYYLIAIIVLQFLTSVLIWFRKAKQPSSPAGEKICREEIEEMVPIIFETIKQIVALNPTSEDVSVELLSAVVSGLDLED